MGVCAGAFEDTKAVVYDFCDPDAGENAKVFLDDWRGSFVCDDFSCDNQAITQGVHAVGCLVHARRKFYDLHASNKSQIAHSALERIARIYDNERAIKALPPDEQPRIGQERSKPLLDALHQWLILNRQKITDGSVSAKALEYRLRLWGALTRFADSGQLPIDSDHIECQIRPIAIGRNNLVFAGSQRAGKWDAAIMSLIQSAQLNDHDSYAYLKVVLSSLPTQRA